MNKITAAISIALLMLAPAANAGTASTTFRVGITILRADADVQAAHARQQSAVLTAAQKCGKGKVATVQVDDWISDNQPAPSAPANVTCGPQTADGQMVTVAF